MISMEDALKIAAEAVKIHRDSNCSVKDSVNAALAIHYEIQAIENKGEKRETVIIFPEDMEKINDACIKYPLGSKQIAEIAELSGQLYLEGVSVIEILENHIKMIEMLKSMREELTAGFIGGSMDEGSY